MTTTPLETETFPISTTHENQFRNRYAALESRRVTNDYERAELASDVRSEFDEGEEGDARMRLFLRKRLLLNPVTAASLVTLAEAIQVFPNRETWNQVGGARAIVYLLSLTSTQRKRVLDRVIKGIAKSGRSTNLAGVRRTAIQLGLAQATSQGRATPTRVLRSNLGVLQSFILANAKRLGNLPAEVRNALEVGA